jgi:hypothetical protein
MRKEIFTDIAAVIKKQLNFISFKLKLQVGLCLNFAVHTFYLSPYFYTRRGPPLCLGDDIFIFGKLLLVSF